MASDVPRFASFRPKPKPPVNVQQNATNTGKPESERQRGENEEQHYSGTRLTKHSVNVDSRHSGDSEPIHFGKLVQHLDHGKRHDLGQQDQPSFFVDNEGDLNNLRFGSIDRYTVPAFRRYGYGSVLGLSPALKIDRDSTTNKNIVLLAPGHRIKERPLASKQSGRHSARSTRFIKAFRNDQFIDGLDFIPISLKTKKTACISENDATQGSYDADGRNVKARAETDLMTDSDVEFESDTVAEARNEEVTDANARLIRKTREHPHDLQAWIDLINHQESMMKMDNGCSDIVSNVDKQHLAAVKLSVYEQALRSIGDNQDHRVQLQLGLITEATRFWETGKLTKKWEDLIAQHSQIVEVWVRYLDFIQTKFASFTYEQCRASFSRCLEALSATPNSAPTEIILHVLVRMTTMTREAGYQELSIAIWQALLEFNQFRPTTTEGQDPIGLFEAFWNSEVPRIGEVGAKGWRNMNADEPALLQGETPIMMEAATSLDLYGVFHVRELKHINMLKYPGRTADVVGEDDPFHLIVFSDIEEYLNILPLDISETMLIDAFLCFCGLPPLPMTTGHKYTWWTDPLLRGQYCFPHSTEREANDFLRTFQTLMRCPSRSCVMTTEILFDHEFNDAIGFSDASLVRNALKLLVSDTERDDIFGEYLLALEARVFPTDVSKTARQLLKMRSSSLRLYNAYGLVESRKGDTHKADLVFSSALSMNDNVALFSTPGSLALFDSWIWEALRHGNSNETLWRLASPNGQKKKIDVEEAKPDRFAILRSRTILSEGGERALLQQDYHAAVLFTSLLALLSYLSGDRDITASLNIHDKLINWFTQHGLSRCNAAELHAQSIARLLTYHTAHAGFVKPSLLRTNLEPLISRFPNNSILLATYAANERRFAINDRVRTIMHDTVLTQGNPSSITGWFFAIYYEMHRGEIAGSTSHSVRALFHKAEDDIGAHCPAIWISHLLFELANARREYEKRPRIRSTDGRNRRDQIWLEENPSTVKENFFRGLTCLPWCKDYMMLAFGELRTSFLSREELRKVYSVMVEKELRLYVELEDE